MSDDFIEPLFVTIVPARYGGAYEPGAWLAFPVSPDNLPRDWNSNDIAASTFFAITPRPYGAGPTPDAAYEDLLRVIQQLNLDPFTRECDWAAFTAERDREIERDMLGRTAVSLPGPGEIPQGFRRRSVRGPNRPTSADSQILRFRRPCFSEMTGGVQHPLRGSSSTTTSDLAVFTVCQ